MEHNWSASFSEIFYVNESSLHKLPNINNFDQFVFLANKYRNIFRNNFLNNARVSYEDSDSFFSNLGQDKSRILYAISYKDEWIGHFGLRFLGNKNIMLDNAIRFSPKGGRTLFKDINFELIRHLRSYLPDYNTLIIVKKGNTPALKLHQGMGFKDCSQGYYDDLSIDSLNFSIMLLD